MSFPRKVGLFKKWAQRMVDGATVDREASSKKRATRGGKTPSGHRSNRIQRMRKSRRRRRRKQSD